MKVRIDMDRCTGHGRCYMLAPGVFEADDSGYGVVISAEVPPSLHDEAQKAADNCPEQAVIIE
jgi:ferredoxin